MERGYEMTEFLEHPLNLWTAERAKKLARSDREPDLIDAPQWRRRT
jgi:hypothetical protein